MPPACEVRYLRASLYTEPGFERAATFALVHPYESYERAPRRHRRATDDLPATVARVVPDLRTLCCGPTVAVVAECLFAGFGVSAES
eukprot:5798582-Pleurochrysis_carterae.AAC.2